MRGEWPSPSSNSTRMRSPPPSLISATKPSAGLIESSENDEPFQVTVIEPPADEYDWVNGAGCAAATDVDGDEVDGDEVDGDEVDGADVDGEDVDGEDVDGDELDGDELELAGEELEGDDEVLAGEVLAGVVVDGDVLDDDVLDAAVVLTALELELLLDDELELGLELELELGAACNRAGASTAASGRSALPESWLAAAKPAAPATKPSAAAAATAARLVNPTPDTCTDHDRTSCCAASCTDDTTCAHPRLGVTSDQSMSTTGTPPSTLTSMRESLGPRNLTRIRVGVSSSISTVCPEAG